MCCSRCSILAVGLATLLAAQANGAIINYVFPIDGLQEVPPVATPGTGTGNVTLDTATNSLSWVVSYSGLLATRTASHFHCPAPPGVNAGVVLGIAGAGPTSDVIVGAAVISDTFESNLLNKLCYVNIHSTFRPGGEIRGQVVPEPSMLALLGAGGLLLLRRRRTT